MGKDKLRKWKENAAFSHVFEPDLKSIVDGAGLHKGSGRKRFLAMTTPSPSNWVAAKASIRWASRAAILSAISLGWTSRATVFGAVPKTSQEEGLEQRRLPADQN